MPTALEKRLSYLSWWLPLLLGLLFTLAMIVIVDYHNQREITQLSNKLADEAEAEIQERFQRYEYGLRGLRGAITAVGLDHLTRAKVEAYIASRELQREFPGALGYGFIRRVAPDQVESFLAAAKADGAPNFAIRELSPNQGERYIIQYIYPQAVNQAAVGLDIASEASRRDAAIAATHTSQAQLTAPLTLVQANGSPRRGFLILLPIYPNLTPFTPEARKSQVVGWSYAPLVVDDVLADLGREMDAAQIQLTDPIEVEPFYSSAFNEDKALLEVQVERDILVMNRHWRLVVTPYKKLMADLHLWQPFELLFLGLALTCVMVVFGQVWRSNVVLGGPQDILDEAELNFASFWQSDAVQRALLPFGMFLLVLFASYSWGILTILKQQQTADLTQSAAATRRFLEEKAELYRHDLLLLAKTPPVNALLQIETRQLASFDSTSAEQWQNRLQEIFTAYMLATPDVLQTQLIVNKNNWQELVKIIRNGDTLKPLPRSMLQQKGQEPYIAQTLQLAPNKVLVGDITLNREFGAIELPHRPVWRFATPIKTDDGQVFAILIINVNAESLLSKVSQKAQGEAQVYLANFQGDFLFHPQSARVLSYEFEQPYRVTDEFMPRSSFAWLLPEGSSSVATPQGEMWLHQSLFHPFADPDSGGIKILSATLQFPFFMRLFWLLSLGVLGVTFMTATVGAIQYSLWVPGQRRVQTLKLEQREQQQQREVTLFQTLLELAPDATLVVDPQGTIRFANAQAEHMFQRSKQQLEGHAVHELLPDAHQAKHQQHVQHFMASPSNRQMGRNQVLYAKRDDGHFFPVEVSLGPVQVDDELLVSASIRDISEWLAHDAKLKLALEQAERATKAKSAFLANTSHEIRTPLNAIIGFTHLLAKESLSRSHAVLVEKIQLSSQALLGIVNDVLDLSKIEADEMVLESTPVELRELIDDVMGIFSPQAELKKLKLQWQVAPDVPVWMLTDSTRIRQILMNLLSNALKFTEEGQVLLAVELSTNNSSFNGVTVRIRVIDTGIGISATVLERLFQPFSQADVSTSRRFGGTGLGLSIVSKLVSLFQGQVGVKSEEGSGSEFWVEIPMAFPDPELLAQHEQRSNALLVLIAEDDANDAAHIRKVVQALGWRIQLVTDGQQLLNVYLNRQQNAARLPDVLLVDWLMPTMDGLAAVYQLAEQLDTQPMPLVIMLTSLEQRAVLEQDTEHRVDCLLHKPLDASRLFNAVNELLTRRTGQSDYVLQRTRTEALKGSWLSGVRVLVVDDSLINLEVVSHILISNGALVHTVDSGMKAIETLRLKPHGYDVVLMDVQMPGMDGFEATRQIRENLGLSALPIVALTAGALVEERRRAFEAGMNDFLTKPIDPSELVKGLREVMEKYHGRVLALQLPVDSKEADGEWPEIDGLNMLQAQRMLLGDPKLFFVSLERILTEYQELMLPPPLTVDDEEAEPLRTALAAKVHKLRGASGLIGAEKLQSLCSKAEQALRGRQEARGMLTEIAHELRLIATASEPTLHRWRHAKQAVADSVQAQSAIPMAAIELNRLLDQLHTQDLAAMALIAQHQASLSLMLGADKFATLQTYVANLDYGQAYSLLAQLKTQLVASEI